MTHRHEWVADELQGEIHGVYRCECGVYGYDIRGRLRDPRRRPRVKAYLCKYRVEFGRCGREVTGLVSGERRCPEHGASNLG